MCGIVGFITKESKKLEVDRSKFLRQGLIVDTLRGDDSTGVMAVGHEPMFDDGSAYWLKQLGNGYDFVNSEDYWSNLYDLKDYRAVIGHNRAATVGGVSADTAHPFQVGPITLVHNGTLRSTYLLPTKMNDIEGVTVDSHAIAWNLANHDTKEVLEALDGAYALVWHDARDDSMNIVRNSERPLHMAHTHQQDTLYICSEGGMLDFLGKRLRLGLKGIYYPQVHQWLKWLPDTPLLEPIVEEIDPDIWGGWGQQHPSRYGGYGGYGTSWYGDDDDEFEDDIPFDKGKSSSPSRTNEKDDWVFVGGRKKPVPTKCQEILLEYNLVVESRMRFAPESFRVHPGSTGNEKRCAVVGSFLTSTGEEMIGILPNLHENCIKYLERDWTVRPVAVKVSQDGQPIVQLRLKRLRWESGESESEGEQEAPDTDDKWRVPGPWNQPISDMEFLRRTADGCSVCGRFVSITEADDLRWSDDGTKVTCQYCHSPLESGWENTVH